MARRGWVVIVVLLTGLVAVGDPAGGTESEDGPGPSFVEPTTPQLIEAAVAAGELDRATADVHLAHAFAAYDEVPARFRSDAPWDGTLTLLKLQNRLASMPPSSARTEITESVQGGPGGPSTATCSSSTAPHTTTFSSTHFYVAYTTISGGLTIDDYIASLETAWTTEVDRFGWAAPPAHADEARRRAERKYHVGSQNLGAGLYGFVSSVGTGAGFVGNNPQHAWNDADAYAVVHGASTPTTRASPGTPQRALDATTAHEFNHSIQFGYGAPRRRQRRPTTSSSRAARRGWRTRSSTTPNDNYNYLWPVFENDMGDYDGSPYPYWITLRGLTERYGAERARRAARTSCSASGS